MSLTARRDTWTRRDSGGTTWGHGRHCAAPYVRTA